MLTPRHNTHRISFAGSLQEAALPEPWLTTARVEGLDARLVALTALTRDGGTWQVVVSLAVAEVSAMPYIHAYCAALYIHTARHAVGSWQWLLLPTPL